MSFKVKILEGKNLGVTQVSRLLAILEKSHEWRTIYAAERCVTESCLKDFSSRTLCN